MVDILLTSEWPKHVLSTLKQHVEFAGGSKDIANLTKFLQPRYHFAGAVSNLSGAWEGGGGGGGSPRRVLFSGQGGWISVSGPKVEAIFEIC